MRKTVFYILTFILLCSCDNSKWETIKLSKNSIEPKGIGEVIYFENENNGVVGGYALVNDENSNYAVKLSEKPTLFLTQDGGRNWREIIFDQAIKGIVRNAYLHKDTLICQIDTVINEKSASIFLSTDGGLNFEVVTDTIEQKNIIENLFTEHRWRYKSENRDFFYENKQYYVKEYYKNEFVSVIVCYGEEFLRNYYFASFDREESWTFLQKATGNNLARFLLEDKYIYCYDSPFGLQRLKLK